MPQPWVNSFHGGFSAPARRALRNSPRPTRPTNVAPFTTVPRNWRRLVSPTVTGPFGERPCRPSVAIGSSSRSIVLMRPPAAVGRRGGRVRVEYRLRLRDHPDPRGGHEPVGGLVAVGEERRPADVLWPATDHLDGVVARRAVGG